MEQIVFQYPAWYFLLCILLGLGFAALLYWKDQSFRDATERSRKMLRGLSILRFLSATIIAFLLLAPLLQSTFTEEEEPLIIFLQDDSESISTGFNDTDSAAYYEEAIAMLDKISNKYSLHSYTFSSQLKEGDNWQWKGKTTDLSKVMDEVVNKYANQNVGAVILATDGIYNNGLNPIYHTAAKYFPTYTIALGDTIPKKDLKISRTYYNEIVYLGDKFNLGIDISAINLAGSQSNLTVRRISNGDDAALEFQQPVVIDNQDFILKKEVVLDADRQGMQHYRIALAPVAGEVSTENNYTDIFIDVLDGRNKILLLAHAPHPDLSVLKQAIEQNVNYEIEIAYANDFNQSLDAFNLIIFHQLPSATYPIETLVTEAKQKEIPIWFVLGSQSALSRLEQMQNSLSIEGSGSNSDEVQATLNRDFSLFTLPESIKNKISKFPPLHAPHGNYVTGSGSHTLLFQKIGAVATTYPLLLFDQSSAIKMGLLAGEGIWRWRFYDQLQNNNHEAFDELIGKVVQYLSVKADKRKFRVSLPQKIFLENDEIVMEAELYNDAYELVNEPDVSITITNEEGMDFTFNFSKTTTSYRLKAGYMPVGNYSFVAKTSYNGQAYSFEGKFSISPLKLELTQTTANHRLLYQLANNAGGEMYYPGSLERLSQALMDKDDIKPVLHDTRKTRAFINLKWIFFLVLLLLGAEWFVRKYNGAY